MKQLLIILLMSSFVFAASYNSYKKALKKGDFDKAISIYSEAINGETTIKYQEYLYKHIIKLMRKDIEKAEKLIMLYLDLEYENHIGLFLHSQIHLLKGDYKNTLEVLYKLKNYYLQNDLSTKVNKAFDTTISSYLEQLYLKNEQETLKQLIDYFISYDDIESIKKTQYTLVKLQENHMSKQQYTEALNILYWLQNTSIEEDFTTQVHKKINFNITKIIALYVKEKDTKNLEALLELALTNADITNQPEIEEALTKLNEKNNLSKIYNKTIPLTKRGEHFILDIIVNGQNVSLMIDTGASYSSLNKDILNNMEYTIIQENLILHTFNGTVKEKLISVNEVTIDDITLRNFTFATAKLNFSDVDGVIGMNFFKKFDFKIDQEQNLLYLSGR
jgi:clan AA aspartic protease (TIGR02281 family)